MLNYQCEVVDVVCQIWNIEFEFSRVKLKTSDLKDAIYNMNYERGNL